MSPSPPRLHPPPPDRRRGPRKAHIAATVSEVRHLVETTVLSYAEIARRTGVLLGTLWRWSKTGKWMRPTFAPRSTHTVPVWRAGRARKRRALTLRVVAVAERYLRALETSAADAARLREAGALLAMAKRATQTPRQRLLAVVRPVSERNPGAPAKAVARKRAARQGAAPVRAVDGIIADARQDGAPRPPHPAAIRREATRLSQLK